MPLVSRDVAIDPFSLSAKAAEPLTGVASALLSFFPLGATGHGLALVCRRHSRMATL